MIGHSNVLGCAMMVLRGLDPMVTMSIQDVGACYIEGLKYFFLKKNSRLRLYTPTRLNKLILF